MTNKFQIKNFKLQFEIYLKLLYTKYQMPYAKY